MTIKQRAIRISACRSRYGGVEFINYDQIIKSLNEGWIVSRMDYLYNQHNEIVANLYILEKEDKS